jgi:catechol 2,3-dioxygenase-like lactoylglutathione lyase family enzyme
VDMKLEVVVVPVSDVDRAKQFYKGLGWREDADFVADEDFRIVQLTPPGSGGSIQFGVGLTPAPPGSLRGMYLVVDDIEAARAELAGRGVDVSEVRYLGPEDMDGSKFVFFDDPDGNGWAVQQIPDYGEGRTQPEGS